MRRDVTIPVEFLAFRPDYRKRILRALLLSPNGIKRGLKGERLRDIQTKDDSIVSSRVEILSRIIHENHFVLFHFILFSKIREKGSYSCVSWRKGIFVEIRGKFRSRDK